MSSVVKLERHLDQPADDSIGPADDLWGERRGPLRPGHLSPTRSQPSGRMLPRFFQAGDGLALIGATLLAQALAEAPGVSALHAAAGLAAFIGLQVFDTYRLGRGEDLALHLT